MATSSKPRHFRKANKPLTLKGSKIMAKKKQAQLLAEQKQEIKPVEKKKAKKLKFPKISRFIPDGFGKLTIKLPKFPGLKLSLKWEIVAVLIILGLIFNWFALKNLYSIGKNWLHLVSERQQISQEIGLWENITKQYPNYRDAYFEGALFAYRLGDVQKENQLLTQLQLIDPNFPLTQGLGKLQNVQ